MPDLLQVLGFNRSQSQAAATSVINRLVEPTSEHSLLDWYSAHGIAGTDGQPTAGAGDDRFYRVGDLLLAHQGAMEEHLRHRQRSLFNLDRTVLLYDLTNTHFEGVCAQNPKPGEARTSKNETIVPDLSGDAL